jgi:GNAT superfamily N-acetyltransferase
VSVHIRRARAEDREGVVDVLSAAFRRPRSWYEGALENWTPDQSWLAVEDARVLAHVRVLDLRIRTQRVVLPVAGVGDVGTLPDARGQGLAGRALAAALDAARDRGLPYSLLWSRGGRLYLRLGFVVIPYARVRLRLSGPTPGVRPFEPADLPDVMDLQRAVGPVERTRADWEFQLRRRSPDERFLVERRDAGELTGYVRAQPRPEVVELLDLAVADDRLDFARPLLAAAARDAPLEGPLPPPLRDGLRASAELERLPDGDDLMGRTLDREALVRTLGDGLAMLDEGALARELWRDFTPWPVDRF